MPDAGGVSIKIRLDEKDAVNELAKLRKKIAETKQDLAEKENQKSGLEERLAEADKAAAAAAARVKELKAAMEAAPKGSPERERLKERLAEANTELRANIAEGKQADRQYENITNKIAEGTENLSQMNGRAADLERQIRAAQKPFAQIRKKAGEAADAMGKHFQKVSQRISKMITGVFMFQVISRALRGLRDYLRDTLTSIPEIRTELAALKGEAMTAVQPLVEALVPLLIEELKTLTTELQTVSGVTANLFGTTRETAAENAKALYSQAEGLDEVGESAKDAKKQLMGFDTLNILSDTETGDTQKSSGGSASIDPTFGNDVANEMTWLDMVVGGLELAVGAILLFSGSPGLGLAMLALGAAKIVTAVSQNWDGIKDKLSGRLSDIMGMLGLATLVIGAVLAFGVPGALPLGLGLMVAGATALATAVAVNWDTLTERLRKCIDTIFPILGGALLVVGAVLAFGVPGALPLGLGLMAAGAAMLGTAVAVNWDSIVEALKGPVGEIVAILSGALLVLGAILTFAVPGARGLGIGLLVAGAAGLAATAALNWDSIVEALKGPVGKIVAIISAALLVLGAILTFAVPGARGLGIGLLVAGAAGLAATAALNWDSIVEALKGPVGKIVAIVSAALLVLGAILTFAVPGAQGLGIGLLVAGAAGLAATAVLNWDSIVEAMRGPFGKIMAIVSGGLLVLGLILLLSGVAAPLGIGLIIAGAAGLAAAVAFNWDFLPDKVKEIWKGITEYWQEHIAPIFTRNWWSEKFANISEGLKAKIKDGVNGAIELLNRFIDWLNRTFALEWDPIVVAGVQIAPAGSFQLFDLPKIPALAEGAVIPPNREFMAVLGDQSYGTNVEAPLDTIMEAVQAAMGPGFEDLVNVIVQTRNAVVWEIRQKDMNVYMDGQDVAQHVFRPLQQLQQTAGTAMVTVG